MSADVTPVQPGDDWLALRFAWPSGKGPDPLTVWQGLRGVCRELGELGERDHEVLDRFQRLGAAADVLSKLLDERLVI
jgi:hypothetical protein